MRNSFVNTMIECAENDKTVALLMAEVGFSVVEPFEKKFPDRFFNTGIAEQNLVLTAAGMALNGMHPVAYSMASFLPSRAFEMIKASVCYQNLPVVLVSVGSGLTYGEMGSTHHAIEESIIMKSLPNMNVEFPSNGQELKAALKYAISSNKPFYISFPKAPDITPDVPHSYEHGKGVKYKDGKDGAIIAVGYSVNNAIAAAKVLTESGIDIAVYGLHTVKPLDKQLIFDAARTKNIFIVDEHQTCGGTGSEIAKIILENNIPLERFKEFSVPDVFVDSVSRYNELLDLYNLSAEKIEKNIRIAIEKEFGSIK